MVLDRTNPSPPDASASIDETRLTAAMEEYLSALETGQPIDRPTFFEKYADLAPQLSTALESLEFVHSISPQHGDDLDLQSRPTSENQTNIDGEELGDYRLIRELGRGGMGVVYEAEERTLGRRIALKVLPFAALLDQRRLARFHNEARAAAMVKHPNIVSVYSVGCQRGIYYYAMELIEGVSLAEVIDQRKSSETDLPPTANHDTAPIAAVSTQSATGSKSFFRTVASLGKQAAEALHYAHQEGIIHRDIKPSNLLLDKDGNLHIADFGLARIHTGDDLTLTGDTPGTLRYMSPEQVAGDQVVDQRGDIYSLGLSLYELVAGHPAFVSSSRQQIMKSICDEEPSPLHGLRQHVPRDLETIIHKAIAKEAEDRYQTAELLADDLRRFLDNRTIRARPATQVERVTRLAKRNPLVASLLAAVVLLLVALSAGSSSVAWTFAQHASRERIRVYARDMRLAKTAVDEARLVDAEQILLKWVPGQGDEDHRGFEWRYLWEASHDEAMRHSLHAGFPKYGVAFSSDGSSLASCGFGKNVSLWRLDQSPMVRPWAFVESDFSEVNDIEFTESGELITADRGGSLNVWNTKSKDPEDMSPSVAATTFPHAIQSVAASDDSRVIAVGVVDRAETGSVHVWDRSSQQQVESSVHLSGRPAVDFGPTGELLVTAANESSLFVLNTENGDVLETIPLDADGASNVKVSPDGRLVAVAIHGQQGALTWSAIDIWELETRTLLHRLALGSALGSSLEFAPRGNRLAVGDAQGTVFLVDLQDDVTESKIVLKRRLHSAQLTGIAFSPDGSCLATCGADSYVHLWDVDKLVGARGNSIFAGSHKPWISSVCYTNEPATVAVAERSGNIRLVDCETGKAGEPLDVDTHGFTHFMVAGARERGLIAIQCSHWPAQNVPGKLVLWDIQQGVEHSSHSLPENVDCSAPAFSYDGKYCATCAGGNVFVIDVAKRKIAKTFGLAAGARVAVFSPKGRWLGLGCTDGVTRLCELSDFDVRHEIPTDGHLAYRVAFSPDEQTIACVGRERRVKLFDVESERLVGEFERTPGFMTLITFSPDGQRILTGGLDGKLRSWMTESGEQLLSLDIRPNCWPNGMFSRDGSAILTTSGFEAKLYRNYSSANLLELSVSELQSDACKNMTSPPAAESGP